MVDNRKRHQWNRFPFQAWVVENLKVKGEAVKFEKKFNFFEKGKMVISVEIFYISDEETNFTVEFVS